MDNQQLVKELSESEKITFQTRYDRVCKSRKIALALTYLLGAFGAHHFYLQRRGLGFMYLLLCWTFVPLIFSWFEISSIGNEIGKFNHERALEIVTDIIKNRPATATLKSAVQASAGA